MNTELQEELLIRRLVERWAVWRDAGQRIDGDHHLLSTTTTTTPRGAAPSRSPEP